VETELVVVHDAARPLVTADLFDSVLATLERDPGVAGVVAAAPVTDTTKEAGEDHVVERTLDRSRLWAVQTPQAFRAGALRAALDSPDLSAASDDAMLVENVKVTTPLDLRVAELVLAERASP
jgi:2-C-methyl-D-erythritol 4-phosphate cytidylyltransferase